MKFSIYIDREDFRTAEKEEQRKFVRSILEEMNIPLEDCWPSDEHELTVEDRIRLRHILKSLDIIMVDDKDGGIKIYVGEDLIAEWEKCTFEYRTDMSQIDPNKRIFYQMNISYWSLFEESIEDDTEE